MIARSRALDRLRAHRRRLERTAEAAASTVVEALDGVTEAFALQPELKEQAGDLAAALEALPPEQREVVLLAFFDGLSHSEIAMQTGQPLGTVKTRIRLAMEKLRQKLGFQRDSHG
jgi:RNA polymerase sigma-70 factor (ECF subfamily)